MRQHYQLFIGCYKGRPEVVAQQQKDGSFKALPGGFSYERFLEQVNQTNIYGVYNLDDAGNVGFILYDMDVFPRLREPWPELIAKLRAKKEQVLALMSALDTLGVEPDQVLVEFPTVGYHVVLPFSRPLPVRQAKAFARLARDRAGLRYEMPLYPREVHGYGDMVRLPLRFNESTGHRSNFVRDIRSFDPARYDQNPDFAPLESLRPIQTQAILKALDRANARAYRRVARAEEVLPGTTSLVDYRGDRVLLVNDGRRLYAVAEPCPHAEGPLCLGSLQDGVLTCPWHGSRFQVATGEVVSGPAPTGLVHHSLRLKGGEIWVGPPQP